MLDYVFLPKVLWIGDTGTERHVIFCLFVYWRIAALPKVEKIRNGCLSATTYQIHFSSQQWKSHCHFVCYENHTKRHFYINQDLYFLPLDTFSWRCLNEMMFLLSAIETESLSSPGLRGESNRLTWSLIFLCCLSPIHLTNSFNPLTSLTTGTPCTGLLMPLTIKIECCIKYKCGM